MSGRFELAPDGQHAVDRSDGGAVLVAHAVVDRHGGLLVRSCPLCGKRHHHGGQEALPALRLSHCADHTRRASYLLVRHAAGDRRRRNTKE